MFHMRVFVGAYDADGHLIGQRDLTVDVPSGPKRTIEFEPITVPAGGLIIQAIDDRPAHGFHIDREVTFNNIQV